MIKEYLKFEESGLYIAFAITDKNRIRLVHFSANEFAPEDDINIGSKDEDLFFTDGYQFAQINYAGYNRPYEKQGSMYIATIPGASMVYDGYQETVNQDGRVVNIFQKDELTDAYVTTEIQFFDGIPTVRFTNTVKNLSSEDQVLEYLGTFSYLGLEKEGSQSTDMKMRVYIPHSSWQKELCWQVYTLEQLGLPQTQPHIMKHGSKNVSFTNTGNWSTKDYIPMGYIENTEADTGLYFQIEHNGSWHWEMGMQDNHIFLNISGPTEAQSHFYKILKPGDSFTTVPVSVGVSRADFSEAMSNLTDYRRRIRRPNQDDINLPVIFNDYMNCLFGDPTTEKEIPLIDAAARAGCEYFVIDAGWYSDGFWWDGVGEWKESRERFPGGIREVTDYIRSKGMKPGVWLELEVMGIKCPLAGKVPDNWFFVRHGKRVYDRSRYQLDFRNPEVIRHVNEVVDRVVNEYGVSYIKMDYNIEPGIGTELGCDSPGDGLLQHERAYLAWLDSVFEKYPDLVIENCSSGGLRMDYAMLKRYSLQSTSDQEDYVQYSTIAANVPSAVTSEQAAVWSYPMRGADSEETIFNMINAMLCRIHQSGHLAELSEERFDLVSEGIRVYKSIRDDIRKSHPYWPLGFAGALSPWVCLAIYTEDHVYAAVWRRCTELAGDGSDKKACEGSDRCDIPFERLLRRISGDTDGWSARVLYPEKANADNLEYSYTPSDGILHVRYKLPVMARLFELSRLV
ncbi:MAG: alpha-galactosidase [Blautia sp.]|nr:alpha-galactosidase [Blautia sp.]